MKICTFTDNFQSGIVITQIGTSPYLFQFKNKELKSYQFIAYELEDYSKQSIIDFMSKTYPSSKIYFDYQNKINIGKTISQKQLIQ